MTLTTIATSSAGRADSEPVLRAAAPRLLAIASVIAGSGADAEDVVQEVMVAAWKAWDRLRDTERRDAWLTRICVREAVRHGQRRRARWLREEAIDDRVTAAPSSASGTNWDAAFAGLSRQQRAAVVLHFSYGYTLDECAHFMGCRPGSARQHLARALRHLREVMNDGD
jgi:RNA polymerase sigma-70 factor, ECF subfamily